MDIEFKPHDVKFEYNLERIIDDFILFCVLVGNDFLPCLPFAEIGENGLDDLFRVYKDHLASASNSPWLTKNCGEVDFKQFLGKTFPGSFPVVPLYGLDRAGGFETSLALDHIWDDNLNYLFHEG